MDKAGKRRTRHPVNDTAFRAIAEGDVRDRLQFPAAGVSRDDFSYWEDLERVLVSHMAHATVAARVTELFYDLENYSLGDIPRPRWYIHRVSNWGAGFYLRADERLRRHAPVPDDYRVFRGYAEANGLYPSQRKRFSVYYDGFARDQWRRLLKEEAP